MLLIAPLKGLRYNPKRIRSLASVVTPPYDIITPQQQRQLYRRHPDNFIRVIYGQKRPSDGPARNVYTRAKRTLDQWLDRGVLRQDEMLSVYPYEQIYRIHGKSHRRTGVIALVSLDSRVYPHERIFGGPKQDRLELTRAVEASLDPIFGLVPDERGRYAQFVRRACRSRKPVASFEFEGVRHRLWRIGDPAWVRKLGALLKSRELVIADGHHRFEAAKRYRDERKKKDSAYRKDDPANFVMFYLSAAGVEEPGLLPTHRLIRALSPMGRKKWLADVKTAGSAEPVISRERLVGQLRLLRDHRKVGMGFYNGNGAGYLLRPGAGAKFHLDVEWLHGALLRKPVEPAMQVSYTQDLAAAYAQVREGRAQAVFVMQRPRLSDVLKRARSGRRMPRKTTYFYPKLPSGLIGYSLKG